MPELDADALRAALGTTLIGRKIIVVSETGSTNDLLFGLTNQNTPEGLVVFAEAQTAGRGQRGNRWHSPPHLGLWFSILLRPQIEIGESFRLTQWLANSIATTINRELSLAASVKSPNDILIASRKVAGVLVEMRAAPAASYVAIGGVGVNVNQQPGHFPAEIRERASSLSMCVGRDVDRHSLAVALLREFDLTYRELFG